MKHHVLKNTTRVVVTSLVLLTTSCNSQKQPTPEQQAVVNKAKENFVYVEGGTFIMGKAPSINTTPEHEVTLDGYSISKYETTFKEFDLYTELNDLDKVKADFRDLEDYQPNYGVKSITWKQAKDYCLWLGKQLNLPISLPTEAQWEYAARSRGLNVNHATNSGKIEHGENDNYNGIKVEVGSFPPNPLGVYDMSGGRPEWTRDWYKGYPREAVTNPVIDSFPKAKSVVVRGFHTLGTSVYNRGYRKPDNSGSGVGFRCVCNQKTPIE